MNENGEQGAFATSARTNHQQGLTKREYFAGLAMQGLMMQAIPGTHNSNDKPNNEYRAKFSVAMADELLKQLEK